jgi:hypothetical protein
MTKYSDLLHAYLDQALRTDLPVASCLRGLSNTTEETNSLNTICTVLVACLHSQRLHLTSEAETNVSPRPSDTP